MTAKPRRLIDDPKLVEKRRPHIIDAAVQLFGKQGFHATTIRDVAEHAGVSVGMIYQYVQDKDDLLYQAIRQFTLSYTDEIDRALEGLSDPRERFLASVKAIAGLIDRRWDPLLMGYRESHLLSRERLAEIMQAEREVAQRVVECAEACVAQGLFKPVDVEMLVYQALVLAQNWPLNSWRFGEAMSVETYIERGMAVLLGPVLA